MRNAEGSGLATESGARTPSCCANPHKAQVGEGSPSSARARLCRGKGSPAMSSGCRFGGFEIPRPSSAQAAPLLCSLVHFSHWGPTVWLLFHRVRNGGQCYFVFTVHFHVVCVTVKKKPTLAIWKILVFLLISARRVDGVLLTLSRRRSWLTSGLGSPGQGWCGGLPRESSDSLLSFF